MTLNLLVWSNARVITGDLGQRCKIHSFLPNFSTSFNRFTLQVYINIHKINQILLILLQILVIIDLLYNLSKYIQFKVFQKCLKLVVYINTLLSPLYRLDRNGRLHKFLRILITTLYFKDLNWISETVFCGICLMVCKIVFCSEFPDMPDNTGKVTRIRRRTQAIAKRYAFQANAINFSLAIF